MPVKVHQLAKELKISTAELKHHLNGFGIVVKSHMTSIPDEIVAQIRTKFSEEVSVIKQQQQDKKTSEWNLKLEKTKNFGILDCNTFNKQNLKIAFYDIYGKLHNCIFRKDLLAINELKKGFLFVIINVKNTDDKIIYRFEKIKIKTMKFLLKSKSHLEEIYSDEFYFKTSNEITSIFNINKDRLFINFNSEMINLIQVNMRLESFNIELENEYKKIDKLKNETKNNFSKELKEKQEEKDKLVNELVKIQESLSKNIDDNDYLKNKNNKLLHNIEILESNITEKEIKFKNIKDVDFNLRKYIEDTLIKKETLKKEIEELAHIKNQLKDKTNKLQQIDFGKDKELFEQKYNDQKKENDELKEENNKLKIQSKNNKKQPNDENKENTRTDSNPVQNILEKIGVDNVVEKLNEHKIETNFNIEDFKEYLKKKGLFYNDETIQDFHYSVLSKRLTILAGQPGCGKSKLMQTYINFMSKNIPENLIKHTYSFIPVKPEWTDPGFLIGNYNYLRDELEVTEFQKICYLAEQCPEIPFYICLDEFNIARPENYFADFLSLRELDNSEHKKKLTFQNSQFEIKLHDNIHFFATINTDATTFELSPKVLDRSDIIELKPEIKYIEKLIEDFKSKHISFNSGIMKFKETLVTFIEKWENEKILNHPLPISYRSVKSVLQLLIIDSQVDISVIDFVFSKSVLIKLHPYDEMDDNDKKYKHLLEVIKNDFREKKLINSEKKIEKILEGASGQTG